MTVRPASFSCVLIGAESLLIQCAEMLENAGAAIRAVVSRAEPIRAWAEARAIPVLAPGAGLEARLAPVEHDYLFSITNLALLPESVLALPRVAAINFHDGPLPRYAGMYAPAWALLEGATEYGVSFHEMTAAADEGALYAQRLFEVGSEETSLTLNTRCYEQAIEAFAELVERLDDGTLTPRSQDLSQRTYFPRYARPPAAAVLDWRRPATDLARIVRALDFGHYENAFAAARVLHAGQGQIVRSAAAVEPADTPPATDTPPPGTLISLDEQGLEVVCGGNSRLRIASATDLSGRSLTPAALAERWGLSVGNRLERLDAAQVERLEAASERAARAEPGRVRRLARLEPIELPYRRVLRDAAAGAAGGEAELDPAGSGVSRESIELPTIADPSGEDGASDWIAALAIYLARVGGRTRFDLSYSDAATTNEVASFGDLFETRLPLRVELDPEGDTDAAREAVRAERARLRERGAIFRDAIARHPPLAASVETIDGVLGGVGVHVGETVDPADAIAGCEFLLALDIGSRAARIHYDPSLYARESVSAIAAQLTRVRQALAEAPRPLGRVPLLAADERRRILEDWNQTVVSHDRSETLVSLFDRQAQATPDATAVVFEGETLRYRELLERANRLAHHLREEGAGPDRLVGVYLGRSLDMVVGVLAILKTGAAYLPLDPEYPASRIGFMIEDAEVGLVLTHSDLVAHAPESGARLVCVDALAEQLAAAPTTPPELVLDPSSLAYVIYTSGSTGTPKGVMVEHRNVVNFFVGMDERIPHQPPGVLLAVTSLSFDISVLELLWTLTRGFELVVYATETGAEGQGARSTTEAVGAARGLDFGLALWGSDAGAGPRKYELMLEAARFADRHGFLAVHTPERHFGAFGGPFPNPSVTSAAIAAVTEHVEIRAGSCVLPLHHPVRVAEEWAVVDNLSNGRVGIAFASGWQPNDFVIRPSAYAEAKKSMFENATIVQRLWRGESVEFENPNGDRVPTATLPRPVQSDLPAWITTAGNVETFREAGARGFNVLSHLLGQTLEELAEKVKVYRRARSDAGLDPRTGRVTCMLHTFVGEDVDQVREIVRQPMKDYLSSAIALVMGFAWSFPAFERPGGPDSKPEDVDLASLSEEETDTILEFAFERYFETSGLFGTPETCAHMVERVKAADIDEVASLIDFGVPNEVVLESLPLLDRVRREANAGVARETTTPVDRARSTLAEQVADRAVTHLQCTPSFANMVLLDPDTRGVVREVEHWLIGGEAFPISLARELAEAGCRNVTNMYGPTETTIWSSTQVVSGRSDPTLPISIGRPIANTRFYILGDGEEPLPVGVAGELLIGGEGVVRGYLGRPDLTAERFVPDPFSDDPTARLYRTGDLARWNPDGTVELLGRLDGQVKIRGHRIEIGEVEARLAAAPGIREAVVIAREDVPGDVRLVAYLIAETEPVSEEVLRAFAAEQLPDFMLPQAYVYRDDFPQTPNGKIDRKAFPPPNLATPRSSAEFEAPESDLEASIAEQWKQVLCLPQVGIDDNFFDLGGHSLLVVQVHRRLRESVPKPISLTDLYRFPTIRGLARHLESDDDAGSQAQASQARGEKRREAQRRRRRGRRG